MFDPREKIALFIDGANLYATSRALGFDIDYRKLLASFQKRGHFIRAYYYTALIEDQEYSSIRPLIDWLDYNGYKVVTKPAKEYTDAAGRRKIKGNMDIELTIDALELAPIIVQAIGDLIRRLRDMGVTIVMAEQNMHFCLKVATHATVIDKGRVVYRDTIDALRADEAVKQRYLSV